MRVPAGHGFRAAVDAALAAPFPAAARKYPDDPTRRLCAVSAALQGHAGAGSSFFLGCRTAAEACGFDRHETAWRRQMRLMTDGLLVRAQVGTLKGRKATKWKWTG